MGEPMSFWNQVEWGDFANTCFKRKNRWKFKIAGVSADGVDSLPPLRGGKPSLSFKEMQAEHLNETIFYPSKPDWKPISLTLYDIAKGTENPVFAWLRRAYDPKNCSLWRPSVGGQSNACDGCAPYDSLKCAQAFLIMYDGCGNELEKWIFEHCWPQSLEFSDGDMSSSELVTCDVTLRFDRAYIDYPNIEPDINFAENLPSYISCAASAPVSMVMFQTVLMPEFIAFKDAV